MTPRLTQVDNLEARYTALIKEYGLKPINMPPFARCTARDLAVRLDKIQRGIIGGYDIY